MTERKTYIDQHQEETDVNTSSNPHFNELLQTRLSRRQTVISGISATAAMMLGSVSLAGCGNSDDTVVPVATPEPELKLGFSPVAKNMLDVVTVPAGYEVAVVYALGDPLDATTPAWKNDGTETADSYQMRAGDHHDGMSFFGLNSSTGKWDKKASDLGLLCLNHENITNGFLHPNGPTTVDGKRPVEEALKEINCHGVSVIAIARQTTGAFAVDKSNALNRRVTPNTVMEYHGPAAASRFLVTKYDAKAKKGRGTLNNCANGYTPWGTYLTCEENWAGYFKRDDDSLRAAPDLASLKRYGATSKTGANAWSTASTTDDRFTRWNTSILDATKTADTDFRNEVNTFGWVVEIDPFTASAAPRKRTALGRFAHEGAVIAPVKVGKSVVFYMGDDSRGEYVYKFVSAKVWDEADATAGLTAGDKYMNDGKLYVAKFNADGTGKWLELTQGVNGLTADNALYPFTSQAAVVVHARLAADSVGATKMDRPEWTAVSPKTGEVYLTLTNNSNRGTSNPVDAANPRNYTDENKAGVKRTGNPHGHIIRWKEAGDDHTATTFTWDVYVFAAEEDAEKTKINVSGLTAGNDMSSPDGLWFDQRGLLWIQTDDGAYTDVTNCMMLAAVAGKVGDGGKTTIDTQDTFKGKNPTEENLRRFLVGPNECEITGVTMTPDSKAIFVNIQHPGEDGSLAKMSSNWPDIANPMQVNANKTARPRSATIVIYRKDGKEIAV